MKVESCDFIESVVHSVIKQLGVWICIQYNLTMEEGHTGL